MNLSPSRHFDHCPICGNAALEEVDLRALRCPDCDLLLNRDTAPLDYAEGGGQAVPDAGKMAWRLENAKRRLAIIAPHLKGHRGLVDIGCGSGEMLLAAAPLLPQRLGFDTNLPLIRHIREHYGLDVRGEPFHADALPAELATLPKAFTLSHVLEHLSDPNTLLGEIVRAMGPGDLLYLEVPLHSGRSFQEQGYGWNLWNHEHLALYSPAALARLARNHDLEEVDRGTRIFARGSHSGKTRLRLLLRQPLVFLRTLLTKPSYLSLADLLIADYGYLVLRRPPARA